jgi:hypothetical protein
MKMLFFVVMAGLVFAPAGAHSQEGGCKFLNTDCDKSPPKPHRFPMKQLSDEEYLQRCLADYVRRKGPFVPEGQSTKVVKSRSDMTSMCVGAIQRKNYYWEGPAEMDQVANYKCCVKSGISSSVCNDNISAMRRTGTNWDFCAQAHKGVEPPPDEWKVPKGCANARCLTTPGYYKSVGYTEMLADPAGARNFVRALREHVASGVGDRESFEAVIRVCFPGY